ncbi:M50 family metallopeptidase [Mucilaginibacter pedocola]|uniref:Uncharacterized protein n=1 Tax=Mucilaginibacter pedocola TaxID=1792845 RepID=A0A1S9PLQ8_9SPHI|nr:M50 family metallopeptidase [Mucilaginibacter pedocola]OOQ61874.1 hypothetical protein BC343_02080 [Mucilaginibacter pedocola]
MNHDWLLLFLFAVFGLLILNVVSFVIIFLHELSHALPAMWFSKEPATIYIGSYGEDVGPKFSIGKLTVTIKPRLSYLRAGGLCTYKAVPSVFQNVVILLAGPVFTLCLAIVLLALVAGDTLQDLMRSVAAIFFIAALLNLINNLYPRKLDDDSTIYSDGKQLLDIIKHRNINKYLFKAASLFDNDDFAATLTELDKIDKAYLNEYICSLYIQSYVELKQYALLTAFRHNFMTPHLLATLTSYNCINLSFANIQLKEYEEALVLLNRAIELNEDYYALNNRGFVNNLLGNYAEAKADLDKAVALDPRSAYAVTNRAYANLKLGQLDEALTDIDTSMELNDGNSYIYLVQGMYQLETGDPASALINFETAKKLNNTTVLVDEYITLAKEKIARL